MSKRAATETESRWQRPSVCLWLQGYSKEVERPTKASSDYEAVEDESESAHDFPDKTHNEKEVRSVGRCF